MNTELSSTTAVSIDFTPQPAVELIKNPNIKTADNVVELSVVIPVYAAEPCLLVLYERLTSTLSSLVESYEIIFIEDCSPDNSWSALQQFAKNDAKVKAFKLSRNFGQQLAITGGLAQCKGRWAVVMDCDLQDPPEEICRLYAKAQEGFDIVMARRKQRKIFSVAKSLRQKLLQARQYIF